MTTVQLVAVLISLTAALAYVNARFLRMPSQVGMLVIGLAGSIALVLFDRAGIVDASRVRALVGEVDFANTLLHGLLGLLLFAGALHVDLDEFKRQRLPIAGLSLSATLLSTGIVGIAIHALFGLFGHPIALVDALLFGALISPTDPIAVMGMLKHSRVPREAAVQVAGESLFNDGIGVVVFTVLLAIRDGDHLHAGDAILLFARQAVGGAAFGLVIGLAGKYLLRSLEEHTVAILVTLALVLGGYVIAEEIGISGPIGAVVAGIAMGSESRRCAAQSSLLAFWQLVDETLNAILFLLLGLEATRLQLSVQLAIVAAIAVPVVLGARLASVELTSRLLRPFGARPIPHSTMILTWGGLRGGLAVALALSLPASDARNPSLVVTYVVVAASVIGQGLTMPWLLRRLGLDGAP